MAASDCKASCLDLEKGAAVLENSETKKVSAATLMENGSAETKLTDFISVPAIYLRSAWQPRVVHALNVWFCSTIALVLAISFGVLVVIIAGTKWDEAVSWTTVPSRCASLILGVMRVTLPREEWHQNPALADRLGVLGPHEMSQTLTVFGARWDLHAVANETTPTASPFIFGTSSLSTLTAMGPFVDTLMPFLLVTLVFPLVDGPVIYIVSSWVSKGYKPSFLARFTVRWIVRTEFVLLLMSLQAIYTFSLMVLDGFGLQNRGWFEIYRVIETVSRSYVSVAVQEKLGSLTRWW